MVVSLAIREFAILLSCLRLNVRALAGIVIPRAAPLALQVLPKGVSHLEAVKGVFHSNFPMECGK